MPSNQSSADDFEPGIPPQEKVLLAAMSVLLIFMPWAIGTMPLWSQLTALGLAALCFVISVLPRPEDPVTPGAVKLIRFPVFHAGLLLMGYIAIQGFNPAWTYLELAGRWYMIPVQDHIDWLPTGTDTAFTVSNPFRYMVILGIPFLACCALWCGITRKSSVFFLFIMLVLNAVVLSILGFAQIFTGADKIFWVVEHHARHTVASFIYRNHAAAYFNLMVGLSGALALYYFHEGRLMLRRSDPSGIFLFFAVILLALVGLSLSRAGAVLGTITLLSLFSVFLFNALVQRATASNRLIAVCIMALVVIFGGYLVSQIDYDRLVERFDQISELDDRPWQVRWSAQKASADMFVNNWFYGTGAGSFRWLFPAYQDWERDAATFGPDRLWQYAHNDVLQYPIELGVVGMAFVVFIIGYFGWQLVVWRTLQNPLAFFLVLVLGITVIHALIDFPFQNPAILTAWCVLLTLVTILVRMENVAERRRRRRS